MSDEFPVLREHSFTRLLDRSAIRPLALGMLRSSMMPGDAQALPAGTRARTMSSVGTPSVHRHLRAKPERPRSHRVQRGPALCGPVEGNDRAPGRLRTDQRRSHTMMLWPAFDTPRCCNAQTTLKESAYSTLASWARDSWGTHGHARLACVLSQSMTSPALSFGGNTG